MSTASSQKNDSVQIVLCCLATFGFGLIMYLSGGNRIIDTANSRRGLLRELREKGTTAAGEWIDKDRGYTYFDTKRLRHIRASDPYIRYTVGNETVEVKADTRGSVSRDSIRVRYLPSDPKESYCTNQADVAEAIQGEIRSYTIHLIVAWAVVLFPAAFGVFILLVSIRPDNGTFNLCALIAVVAASLSLYLYLVW